MAFNFSSLQSDIEGWFKKNFGRNTSATSDDVAVADKPRALEAPPIVPDSSRLPQGFKVDKNEAGIRVLIKEPKITNSATSDESAKETKDAAEHASHGDKSTEHQESRTQNQTNHTDTLRKKSPAVEVQETAPMHGLLADYLEFLKASEKIFHEELFDKGPVWTKFRTITALEHLHFKADLIQKEQVRYATISHLNGHANLIKDLFSQIINESIIEIMKLDARYPSDKVREMVNLERIERDELKKLYLDQEGIIMKRVERENTITAQSRRRISTYVDEILATVSGLEYKVIDLGTPDYSIKDKLVAGYYDIIVTALHARVSMKLGINPVK